MPPSERVTLTDPQKRNATTAPVKRFGLWGEDSGSKTRRIPAQFKELFTLYIRKLSCSKCLNQNFENVKKAVFLQNKSR